MNARQEELLARTEQAMSGAMFWGRKHLTEVLHIPPQATAQIVELGISSGRIIRLEPDVLTLPLHLEKLVPVIRSLSPRFTVADFRKASELPRAHVPSVLDWFDSQGLTRREDDQRIVIG
jgi:hypothetical protein